MTENIPWKTLTTESGDVPFYIIQFDKDGRCTSPKALADLLKVSKSKTDVFLFAHGWNNDWADATARYDIFVEILLDVRRTHGKPLNRPYEPVLVGVFWPSAILTAPWERGPDIAGVDPLESDLQVIDDALPPDEAATIRALLAKPDASTDDAERAAEIIASALDRAGDELGSEAEAPPIDSGDLLETWKRASFAEPEPEQEQEEGGFIEDQAPAADVPDADDESDQPDAAGFNPLAWIRDGVRAFTVLQMKDRAGKVGANGVALMLRSLADDTEARIHLIGHSYGAKLLMSALCVEPEPSRDVDSALLLQPAFSCYGFTDDLEGRPGGYRTAIERVRQPIIATRSDHDTPLRRLFHLAVRRESDLAEAQIAGEPPSKFAALGGYGPQHVPGGEEWIDMPDAGRPYPKTTKVIYAVDGTKYISGHGAVETPQTAWALLTQVMG
jgi:hypothetical protein